MWSLGGAMVTLDVWPWLDPLAEIDGQNEQVVRSVAAALGLDWQDAVFGGIMIAYQRQHPQLNPAASIIDLQK